MIIKTPVTPTPPTLTQLVAVQRNAMSQAFNNVTKLFNGLANFVWNNAASTPQQVFDAYGVDAGELVRLANAVSAMLGVYTGVVPQIVPNDYSLTVNNDGTVTVVNTYGGRIMDWYDLSLTDWYDAQLADWYGLPLGPSIAFVVEAQAIYFAGAVASQADLHFDHQAAFLPGPVAGGISL